MSAIPKAVLYHSPHSVWSSAALLALYEKGYGNDEVDLKIVDTNKGEEFSPTFLRLSPKAVVPTLVVPLRGSLASDMESRFKAVTDTKALIEFLDKSRSVTSHTHTTSSAPAPSLSPATVELANVSREIIDIIQTDEVSPDHLLHLNARDRTSLQELGKSLVPVLESKRAAIAGHLTDCANETIRMSEKTKAFWREKKMAIETVLRVFSGDDVEQYLAHSKKLWEITIPETLAQLNKELIGPYALGDQISIADLHLSAWLCLVVKLAGGNPSDDGDTAMKKVEKHIGNGFVLPEDFLPSTFGPFTDEKPVLKSKLATLWDAMRTRASWKKVYAL